MLCMSLWFYGYFNYYYLLVILSSIIVNYIVAKKDKNNKKWLISGLVFNIGMLFVFKYFDFFLSNVNAIFKTGFNMFHIALPLGISFFTFQQISYIVDSYKGQTDKDSLLDYAVYITFFPQLVAGPIVTHDELIVQIKDKSKHKVDFDNIAKGLMIFTIGLFKKVIVADLFGNLVDFGFSDLEALSTLDTLLVIFSYTMQIYFDFSAYSDMAIGIGKMFNFTLPVNFNSPYKALSVPDFWKRWHITLTRFLTKYVYIPLGGNRKGTVRTYVNIMIVFLISGLWHGAAWTFVLWGGLHGLFQVLTKMFQKGYDKLHKVLQWIFTFAFLNATWIIFRAESLSNLKVIVNRLLSGEMTLSNELGGNISLVGFDFFKEMTSLYFKIKYIKGFDMILFYGLTFIAILGFKNVHEREYKFNVINIITTVTLLVWCILSMSGVMKFIYFNF